VLGVETGLELNNKDKERKGKRSAKKEVRVKKICFEDKRKKHPFFSFNHYYG